MSEISVNREEMDRILARQTAAADGIDLVLNGLPEAVDGGEASDLIAYMLTAVVEGSSKLADSHRLMAAVATDILDDWHANEEQAANEFEELQKRLDQ